MMSIRRYVCVRVGHSSGMCCVSLMVTYMCIYFGPMHLRIPNIYIIMYTHTIHVHRLCMYICWKLLGNRSVWFVSKLHP